MTSQVLLETCCTQNGLICTWIRNWKIHAAIVLLWKGEHEFHVRNGRSSLSVGLLVGFSSKPVH